MASLRTLGPVLHAAQTRDTYLDTTHANLVRVSFLALLLYFFRILPSGNKSLRGISWRSFVITGLTGGLGWVWVPISYPSLSKYTPRWLKTTESMDDGPVD